MAGVEIYFILRLIVSLIVLMMDIKFIYKVLLLSTFVDTIDSVYCGTIAHRLFGQYTHCSLYHAKVDKMVDAIINLAIIMLFKKEYPNLKGQYNFLLFLLVYRIFGMALFSMTGDYRYMVYFPSVTNELILLYSLSPFNDYIGVAIVILLKTCFEYGKLKFESKI